jgi:hypothetical protein
LGKYYVTVIFDFGKVFVFVSRGEFFSISSIGDSSSSAGARSLKRFCLGIAMIYLIGISGAYQSSNIRAFTNGDKKWGRSTWYWKEDARAMRERDQIEASLSKRLFQTFQSFLVDIITHHGVHATPFVATSAPNTASFRSVTWGE